MKHNKECIEFNDMAWSYICICNEDLINNVRT